MNTSLIFISVIMVVILHLAKEVDFVDKWIRDTITGATLIAWVILIVNIYLEVAYVES